tara:strand:- start:1213 stop:2010 length:798 start_codon:yes stop_codon:yes gene_type:complete
MGDWMPVYQIDSEGDHTTIEPIGRLYGDILMLETDKLVNDLVSTASTPDNPAGKSFQFRALGLKGDRYPEMLDDFDHVAITHLASDKKLDEIKDRYKKDPPVYDIKIESVGIIEKERYFGESPKFDPHMVERQHNEENLNIYITSASGVQDSSNPLGHAKLTNPLDARSFGHELPYPNYVQDWEWMENANLNWTPPAESWNSNRIAIYTLNPRLIRRVLSNERSAAKVYYDPYAVRYLKLNYRKLGYTFGILQMFDSINVEDISR